MRGWPLAKSKMLALITVLAGGVLVLASYIRGLITDPARASALWGGVPETWLPLYTISMVLAAVGYLLFTFFLFFRAHELGIFIDFRRVWLAYVAILVPSALWMPLTIEMVTSPSPSTWAMIRLMLTLVALGGLALVITLVRVKPRSRDWSYWAALIGSVVFFLHTAVLDAILWPVLFSY